MAIRIAHRWFERWRVDENITLLWEPYVHRLLQCNIWHVRGRDRDLMIDTGIGVMSLREAARDLLKKPVLAVATHTHGDHTGGIHEFDERVVHKAEAESMTTAGFGMFLTRSQMADSRVDYLNRVGYVIDTEELVSAYPHEGFDPRDHLLHPAPPTRIVEEGDVIDIGDRAFEVLHLPGHTPGGLALWEAKTGTLFSGDTIYDGPLLYESRGAVLEDYRRTMLRLREMPVTVVHGGHDPSFGRERLLEIIDEYLELWDG